MKATDVLTFVIDLLVNMVRVQTFYGTEKLFNCLQ